MSTQTVQMIAYREEPAEVKAATQPHVLVYGCIYIFTVLTALALYVMFTVPQGEI